MKETEYNNYISEMIDRYASQECIQPSSSLNQQLLNKLNNIDPKPNVSIYTKSYYTIVILLVMANIALIFAHSIQSAPMAVSRSKGLQLVCKEFLINPTEINN